MFSHEKLQVYSRALEFVSQAAAWTANWDKRHAVSDQLDRAAQSIVLNLAEAARRRGAASRLQILDYATGSSLECAGCLDVAQIKNLVDDNQCQTEKRRLCEVTKMLIGLRKAWADSVAREDPAPYSAPLRKQQIHLFHHESLDAYQAALAFMRWFASQPGTGILSNHLLRLVDEAGTSIVLNIAEGNGRYAELDHHRFIQIAQEAAVKAAVGLDLCSRRGVFADKETGSGKDLLRKIGVILSGF